MCYSFNFLTDVDECTMVTHDCSSYADCSNVMGSFQCICKSGFTGDGRACEGTCRVALHSGIQMARTYSVQQDKHTDRERQTDKQTVSQLEKQIYRQTDRRIEGQTDRNRQKDTQTNYINFFLFLIELCIANCVIRFNFSQMWTNVRWLSTTVPLTPIVLMLWDHFSVHVNLDSLAMVKHVEVRAGWSLPSDIQTKMQLLTKRDRSTCMSVLFFFCVWEATPSADFVLILQKVLWL